MTQQSGRWRTLDALLPALQQFRHAMQLMLGNISPEIDIKCVDPTLGGHYTPFPQVSPLSM